MKDLEENIFMGQKRKEQKNIKRIVLRLCSIILSVVMTLGIGCEPAHASVQSCLKQADKYLEKDDPLAALECLAEGVKTYGKKEAFYDKAYDIFTHTRVSEMKYYGMSDYSDFMMTFEIFYPFNDTPLEEAKKVTYLKAGMKRLYDDQGRWIATVTYDKENPLPDGDIPLQDLEEWDLGEQWLCLINRYDKKDRLIETYYAKNGHYRVYEYDSKNRLIYDTEYKSKKSDGTYDTLLKEYRYKYNSDGGYKVTEVGSSDGRHYSSSVETHDKYNCRLKWTIYEQWDNKKAFKPKSKIPKTKVMQNLDTKAIFKQAYFENGKITVGPKCPKYDPCAVIPVGYSINLKNGYKRDKKGRIIELIYGNSKGGETYKISYDSKNRVSKIVKGDTVVKYQYTSNGYIARTYCDGEMVSITHRNEKDLITETDIISWQCGQMNYYEREWTKDNPWEGVYDIPKWNIPVVLESYKYSTDDMYLQNDQGIENYSAVYNDIYDYFGNQIYHVEDSNSYLPSYTEYEYHYDKNTNQSDIWDYSGEWN